MPDKRFTNIKYLIPEAAKQHKAQEYFYKYKIMAAWEQVAKGFFEESKELTKAIDFKAGKLTIGCLSEKLAAQIRQVAAQILRALNEFLGWNAVYGLIVEV